ncbi:hypothetical protein H0H92_002228 [Tricholoma furcatifolium]|nr:hypothetical protein H0H92_002228 [Tricholoma furcatifolium]
MLLAQLSSILSPTNLAKLKDLVMRLHDDHASLLGGNIPQLNLSDPMASLQKASEGCSDLETASHVLSYRLMVHHLQFYTLVEYIRATVKTKGEGSDRTLSSALKLTIGQFQHRVNFGTRVAYLVAAGCLHILLIVATLDMKADFVHRKKTCHEDIYGIGFVLRDPQHDERIGPLVKEVLIPFIKCLIAVPLPPLPLIFSQPTRHVIYISEEGCLSENLTIIQNPELRHPQARNALPQMVTIQMAYTFTSEKFPMPKSNRKEWTNQQRSIAAASEEITSLDKLKAKLSNPKHVGGGLLITDFPNQYPKFNTSLITAIQALFPGEFREDDSDRDDYSFLSCHYSYYNRFSEKGTDAPTDIHPHYLRKESNMHSNNTQRAPRTSKEMKRDLAESDILGEFLQTLMEFVRIRLEYLLPEEYHSLRIYVEDLPMNEHSPAYPFGGYVLNMATETLETKSCAS